MVEYFTKAIVLDREPKGEIDADIALYTEDLGRVYVTVKSIDKIISKLSGHFVLGNLVEARIIEKGNLQLVDGLSEKVTPSAELLKFLSFLEKMTPLHEPDLNLWHEVQMVAKGTKKLDKSFYRRILSLLGFDPEFAKCDDCSSKKIAYFYPADIMFLCRESVSKFRIPEDELVSI